MITSSAAAGRLLGLSSETPQVSEVLEDILTLGQGLDIVEREVDESEVADAASREPGVMCLGVVRDGELIRFDDPRSAELRTGDKVIELRAGS